MDIAASPILDAAEVIRRKSLLGALYVALTEAGVRCVPTSRRRLVLEKLNQTAPLRPSGPIDPVLWFHITDEHMGKVTTDCAVFRLDTGRLDDDQEFPIGEVALVVKAASGLALGASLTA